MNTVFSILGSLAILFYFIIPCIIVCAIAVSRRKKRR